MKKEFEEMERYVDDNIQSPQLYIESGELEPVHLQETERKFFVDGMFDSLLKCICEIQNS